MEQTAGWGQVMRAGQICAKQIGISVILLAAIAGVPAAIAAQAPPCAAADKKPCPKPPPRPTAARDGYLHRPSTPEERAETARLNREFNHGNQQTAAAPVVVNPYPVPLPAENSPPPRNAENSTPPAAYQSQMEEYRALREAYDRQLRAYYRAFPPKTSAHAAPAELAGQDAARADPWHAFNGHNGPGNGY